jgi:hypothetical protein
VCARAKSKTAPNAQMANLRLSTSDQSDRRIIRIIPVPMLRLSQIYRDMRSLVARKVTKYSVTLRIDHSTKYSVTLCIDHSTKYSVTLCIDHSTKYSVTLRIDHSAFTIIRVGHMRERRQNR